ncbi:succinate dehydrogenase iron-sulfur protein [Candidatus Blochmanniella floridana]|uniref:Succinate dehydrogenase iron-sulfur subunit n=1 Tax=Blochmanniella floridana TaxID=203907 RepID=Q7VR92_BLOFL|nr:succinate dehydrogenase iron-sulfur protein [Candidatus Blochmannia floridanus]
MQIKFSIYRFCPEVKKTAYIQEYVMNANSIHKMTLLDALIKLKEQDPTLTFRRSCREGVCGSDGMNINGTNSLACITPLIKLINKRRNKKINIRPLPGFPVIRDLVVDMSQFYLQYEKVKPFLINDLPNQPSREYLQSPEERSKLDGSYECILCACCSSACPSFWWNPEKFIGPAGLLTLYRFLIDSRDTHRKERLKHFQDSFSVFRCHNIMNCVSVCPKKLNPAQSIGHIKRMLIQSIIKK